MRTRTTTGFLINFDLDGVLCIGDCWSAESCLLAKPIKENIELLYKLIHNGHHIHIYTARKEWWRPETESWLLKNRVPYHALIMNKAPCDLLVDDRAISIKELRENTIFNV